MEEKNLNLINEDQTSIEKIEDVLAKEVRVMLDEELEAIGGGNSCRCYQTSSCMRRT